MPIITEVIVIALIISLIMATIKKFYDWICSCFAGSNLPTPPAYPILRHLPYFWGGFNDDITLMRWANDFKKEGLFKFDVMLGPQRICIFKEEFLKKILVTNSKKYLRASVIPNTFPTIANGLFASNGKEHAWQRKLINPIFSYSSVLGFVKAFDTNTANLIKHWKNAMGKSLTGVAEVDILHDFNKLTLDVIGETAFGYNFETLVSGENKVSQAVSTLLKGRLSVMGRFLRRFIPFYEKFPLKENVAIKEATKVMQSIVQKIIQQKRAELENSGGQAVATDLLAKMILLKDDESGKTMSDNLIEAEVHTFMIAGHETTSVALTWTFYLLAKHPEIQGKARKEAQEILGDSETVESEHLDKMEYITAVVNESLRIRSPASIFLREVGTEDQLGEYKIPKGAVVIIPICVLHRSEENWKNHDKFIPERFLGEQEISNYKFMSFSNGPRNCIGRKFAMVELKVAVAKLLKTFKFQLDPNQGEIATNLRLTLKPVPNPILRVSLVN